MSSTHAQHTQAGVRPGDVLAGKYRVERVLGVGGMGVVVAAHHLQLDEKVALKFLLPEALDNRDAVARFAREARAAVKIKNEHVARVTDVGQLDSGAPFMVMEYLEGGDLAAWLTQRGPLPIEQAVDFVLQACEALADAHALGIVHRDLKPANLFCIRRSHGQLFIKVLDFGISKVTKVGASGQVEMTRTNALVGSPLYMSPEQMQSSKGVDSRTDLWSLGVILFELVTGRAPFQGESVTELAVQVVTQPAPALRSFRPDAPEALERAVFRCLEKERERRFQNVGELAVALRDLASKTARASVERVLGTLHEAGLSGAAMLPSVELAEPPAPASSTPGTLSSWGQTGTGARAGGRTFLAVVAALVLVAIGGVVVLVKSSTPALAPAAGPGASASVAPSSSPSVPEVTLAPLTSASTAPSASAPASIPAARPVTPSHPASPPPGPAPASKANCDPPYYFDAKGDRLFKKECL